MKRLILKVLQGKLAFLATRIVKKYQPDIIAVTGSVGKTSTTTAIETVLVGSFSVRRSAKNYNNEIGIPLSVIGADAPGRSMVGWLKVFWQAMRLLVITQPYPKILILEMGADHPGDITYLTSLVPIKLAVVTAVAPAHLEYFKSLEAVAKEKGVLVKAVPSSGWVVLNADDRRVYEMKALSKGAVITYGLAPHADIQASDPVTSQGRANGNSEIAGLSFKLQYQGKSIPVLLPNVLGEHLVGAVLASIAVGTIYKIPLHELIERIKQFSPPRGRMCLLPGVKQTLLIDDTYNASPLATRKAIEQLAKLPLGSAARRFAVLGDMLELGTYTEQAHREIGQVVQENKIDFLITVGECSRDYIRGALEQGMPNDRYFHFPNTLEAGRFLQEQIQSGDAILIKGSQGMRMERIVKEVMAQPERASELLVRQSGSWQRS